MGKADGEWETEAKGGAQLAPGALSQDSPLTLTGVPGVPQWPGWGWERTSQKYEEPSLPNLGAPMGSSHLNTFPTTQVTTTPLKGAETHLNTK